LLVASSVPSLFTFYYYSWISGECVRGENGDEHAEQEGWLVINEMEK
jgi:hypothetical protein